MDQNKVAEIDKSNMRQDILDAAKQFKIGVGLSKDVKISGDFESITISGMGGSALPGDLIRIYLKELAEINPDQKSVGVNLNRFYELPTEAFQNSLNLILSYSGNTEETISALAEVLEKKLPVIAMASGGEVEKMAVENQIPFIKIPAGLQPRVATGYFFGAIVAVLAGNGMIGKSAVEEIIQSADFIDERSDELEKRGSEIAKQITGKIPVIYASDKFRSVAMVWKIKFNENSKIPSFWNYFPEMNHNEINGFENPEQKFIAFLLRDSGDHLKNLKRYQVIEKIYQAHGVECVTIDMEGKNAFEKIFLSLALSEWISFYVAIEKGINPNPVGMVEELKALLK